MTDEEITDAAKRMARRLRWIVQGCLREEEWREADEAFAEVIVEELKRLERARHGNR